MILIEQHAATDLVPAIFIITFSGLLSVTETSDAATTFARKVQALRGAPFRVVCDFEDMATMPQEPAEVFMRAQALAVESGMDRDAFVTRSAVVRMQLDCLARLNHRAEKLGALAFFEARREALMHVEQSERVPRPGPSSTRVLGTSEMPKRRPAAG